MHELVGVHLHSAPHPIASYGIHMEHSYTISGAAPGPQSMAMKIVRWIIFYIVFYRV